MERVCIKLRISISVFDDDEHINCQVKSSDSITQFPGINKTNALNKCPFWSFVTSLSIDGIGKTRWSWPWNSDENCTQNSARG